MSFCLSRHVQGRGGCEGVLCMVTIGQFWVGSRLYQTIWFGLCWLQEWTYPTPEIFCLLVLAVFERWRSEKREGRVITSTLTLLLPIYSHCYLKRAWLVYLGFPSLVVYIERNLCFISMFIWISRPIFLDIHASSRTILNITMASGPLLIS